MGRIEIPGCFIPIYLALCFRPDASVSATSATVTDYLQLIIDSTATEYMQQINQYNQ